MVKKRLLAYVSFIMIAMMFSGCGSETNQSSGTNAKTLDIHDEEKIVEFVIEKYVEEPISTKDFMSNYKFKYGDVTDDGQEEAILIGDNWHDHILVIRALADQYEVIMQDEASKYSNDAETADGFLKVMKKSGGTGIAESWVEIWKYDGKKMQKVLDSLVTESSLGVVGPKPYSEEMTSEFNGPLTKFEYTLTSKKTSEGIPETKIEEHAQYTWNQKEFKFDKQELSKELGSKDQLDQAKSSNDVKSERKANDNSGYENGDIDIFYYLDGDRDFLTMKMGPLPFVDEEGGAYYEDKYGGLTKLYWVAPEDSYTINRVTIMKNEHYDSEFSENSGTSYMGINFDMTLKEAKKYVKNIPEWPEDGNVDVKVEFSEYGDGVHTKGIVSRIDVYSNKKVETAEAKSITDFNDFITEVMPGEKVASDQKAHEYYGSRVFSNLEGTEHYPYGYTTIHFDGYKVTLEYNDYEMVKNVEISAEGVAYSKNITARDVSLGDHIADLPADAEYQQDETVWGTEYKRYYVPRWGNHVWLYYNPGTRMLERICVF